MKNSKTILIFLAGLLTGFVFSVAFLPSYFTERAPKNGENTASVMIDSGEKIIICESEPREGATAFDLLESCSEEKKFQFDFKVYEGMGVLIESIDGFASSDGKYWQYWVNNEYAQISSDNFKIFGGDVMLWKLTDIVSE